MLVANQPPALVPPDLSLEACAAMVVAHHRTHWSASNGLVRPRHAGTKSAPAETCWCGGAVGGATEAYLPPVTGAEAVAVYREYCPCPVGQHLNALEDRLRRLVWQRLDQERVGQLWQRSSVPPHYEGLTLDTYPVTPATAPALERLRGRGELEDGTYDGGWLAEEHRWLLLHGPYGTGKTGLAVALMRELLELAIADAQKDCGALFITVPDLLSRLRQSYDVRSGAAGATEADLLRSLNDVPLLVLDDLGAERATDWAVERLFAVINHRHDYHRRTIITSNLGPAELARHIGERTLWRIVEMCRRGPEDGADYIVKVDGPNLRERQTTQTSRSDRASSRPDGSAVDAAGGAVLRDR